MVNVSTVPHYMLLLYTSTHGGPIIIVTHQHGVGYGYLYANTHTAWDMGTCIVALLCHLPRPRIHRARPESCHRMPYHQSSWPLSPQASIYTGETQCSKHTNGTLTKSQEQ